MDAILKFAKTTIVGGLLFLTPVAIVLIVVKQALPFAHKLADPVARQLPAGTVAGIGVTTLVAAAILLLACFLAGLVATTGPGKRLMAWFEDSLLGGLPQYQMVKAMASGLARLETTDGIRPVLVEADGGWQLGYRLETLGNDWLAVFVPQAPTPMSGNVLYLPAGRVRPLDITLAEAMRLVKHMGLGSGAALRGVALAAGT